MNYPIVCTAKYDYGTSGSMGDIYGELLNHIHLVDHYKSDLIIEIKSIEKAIDKINDGEQIVRWIGFRESGVDHLEYIYSAVFTGSLFGGVRCFKEQSYYFYRRLFKLTINAENGKVTATLEKKDIGDFVKEYKDKEPENNNK